MLVETPSEVENYIEIDVIICILPHFKIYLAIHTS